MSISGVFKNFLCVSTLLAFSASSASAVSVDYDLNGLFGLRFVSTNGAPNFRLAFGYGAGGPAQDFNFLLNDDGSGVLSGTLTGAVVDYSNTNNTLTNDIVTATIELNYTGLNNTGTDAVTGNDIDAIGRAGADGKGTITIESDFFGGAFALEFDLSDKFAFPNGGITNHATYGDFGSAPFNLILGQLTAGGGDVFKAWFMADASVNILLGQYNVAGDGHATVTGSTVPEPSAMALLGMGVLAAAIRRRRQTS